MATLHIKKGDEVLVIRGRDRGSRGRVLRVLPAAGKAVVEGINMIKKHTRANPSRNVKGGILEKEAPIALASLMLLDPGSGKPTRVGRKRLPDGSVVRIAKVSGGTIG
jgi:large subunit ribosomal protein L24